MKKYTFLLCLLFALNTSSQDYDFIQDIQYQSDLNDSYLVKRSKLDIYYPRNVEKFPTVIFFHGGGLRAGNKNIPQFLKEKKIAVVAPNYRFSPKVKAPKYIEDAAASVAWVFNNIEKYGGDKNLIFVSGNSAGGYLTSLIGLDKKYLAKHNIDANDIAGLIPVTGHAITHFTVRDEMGIDALKPVIDDFAPLYHVRPDAPPILLLTGNRELELLGRYEENAYLMRMLKLSGHKEVEHLEFDGYGHGISIPAMPVLLRKVNQLTERIRSSY
jgi:acetyl esterase/lipase